MDRNILQATRLWTLAQPAVSAFIGSLVRDFAARDDILQETAVAVLESFDRYDEERPFVGWALGIARNQVRQYLRRETRDRRVFSEATEEALSIAFASSPKEAERPLDRLRECLEHLEGRAKTFCELRYVRDLKPAAIASLTGTTANGVAKALQRIRDELRDCVELAQRGNWGRNPGHRAAGAEGSA